MRSFRELEQTAADIAFLVPTGIKNKINLRNTIINMVVNSCLEYQDNPVFKEDIDKYLKDLANSLK